MPWKIEAEDPYCTRHRQFEKKHNRELLAVLNNLDTFFKALQAGAKPQQIKHGFIHPEPLGVLAIDQKGGGGNLAQTRLYIYPEVETEILHIITLGDKRTQRADIKTTTDFVKRLREKGEKDHGQEEDSR